MTIEWIDSHVHKLKEEHSTDDPEELFRRMDVRICRIDPSSPLFVQCDAICVNSDRGRCAIFIRNDLSPAREKFVLSHELGHVSLHKPILRIWNNGLVNKGKYENQADYFACRLTGEPYSSRYELLM